MLRLVRTGITAALALGAAATLAAEGSGKAPWPGASSWTINPTLNERFTIFGGVTFISLDAKVASTRKSSGVGGTIDDDDVGLDGDDVSPVIGGQFRFGSEGSWKLKLSYFGNDASGNETISKQFTYEGVTYDVGADVKSELNTDLFVATLGWAPFKTEKYELGLGLGVHVADLEMKFEGAGTVNGTPFNSVIAKTDTLAPLPNLWLYGGYAFTPKLSLQAAFGWLGLTIGDYEGEILTAVGSLEYRPRERIGIGAGYRYISTDLTVNKTTYRDKYDIDYYGPFVHMSLGF